MRGVADRVVARFRRAGRPYCIEAVTHRFSATVRPTSAALSHQRRG